ncbi:MAG: hypothetical protein GY851_35890, partial [bacterium]|nr:hypothetical protein [bacterium]
MTPRFLDRRNLYVRPLSERPDRIHVDGFTSLNSAEPNSGTFDQTLDEIVDRIVCARESGSSRMMTFGAHAIKNGMGSVLAGLTSNEWLTHLATNGAGVIHDWEFAYQGHSSEDVRTNVAAGTFGIWEETGFYINLAVRVGAYRGLGYGASVAELIHREGLDIPSREQLAE